MPNSPAHERVTKVLVLLTKFRKDGVVKFLSKHSCDANSGPAVYYLPCVEQLREDNDGAVAVMLTNLNPNGENASRFAEKDIFVMNIASFIDVFVST